MWDIAATEGMNRKIAKERVTPKAPPKPKPQKPAPTGSGSYPEPTNVGRCTGVIVSGLDTRDPSIG